MVRDRDTVDSDGSDPVRVIDALYAFDDDRSCPRVAESVKIRDGDRRVEHRVDQAHNVVGSPE
jgi:hypothetical protein